MVFPRRRYRNGGEGDTVHLECIRVLGRVNNCGYLSAATDVERDGSGEIEIMILRFEFLIRTTTVRGLIVVAMLLVNSVTMASDDLSKPIKSSSDGHFLLQSDGQPFFWLGDTALEIFTDLTLEEATAYFESRAAKGFNVVMAVATGLAEVRDINGPNRYGEKPFLNDDVTSPNERYWKNVDRVIKSAAEKGIRIALLPTWGQATVTRGGEHVPFNEDTATAYGKWIANRYRNSGITWVMGGDTNPIWLSASSTRKLPGERHLEDYTAIYDAMALAIVSVLGESAFITYYPACCSWPGTAQPRSSLYLGHKTWLGMNMIQSSHFNDPTYFNNKAGFIFGWRGPFNYEPVREEYDSYPTRPILDGEPAAEDIPIDTGALCLDPREYESAPRYTDYDIRLRAYHSVFSGAAGAEYTNNNYSWYFYDPSRHSPSICGTRSPWSVALNSVGADQMHHLKDLMLSRPYLTRIPDQSIVKSDAGEGAVHISATRAKSGEYMMVYLPTGQSIAIDMNGLTGPYATAWWYDPRTGEANAVRGTFPTNRITTFVPPTSGTENDWILVVDNAAKGFPPPGRPLQ